MPRGAYLGWAVSAAALAGCEGRCGGARGTAELEPVVADAAAPPPIPREPAPSLGCARDADLGPRLDVDAGGARRTAIVRGARAGARAPRPLVLAFHGSGGDGAGFARWTKLEERLDALVVYPDAVVRTVWADHRATHWGATEDLPFVDALVGAALAGGCVDRARIFAVGWSSGGYFANQLACARADALRAVVAFAGGPAVAACPRPVATWMQHDTDDGDVAYATGLEALAQARTRNACGKDFAAAAGPCRAALGCAPDAPLVFCPTHGHGHPPPPAALEAAARFLEAFAEPARGAEPAGETAPGR